MGFGWLDENFRELEMIFFLISMNESFMHLQISIPACPV